MHLKFEISPYHFPEHICSLDPLPQAGIGVLSERFHFCLRVMFHLLFWPPSTLLWERMSYLDHRMSNRPIEAFCLSQVHHKPQVPKQQYQQNPEREREREREHTKVAASPKAHAIWVITHKGSNLGALCATWKQFQVQRVSSRFLDWSESPQQSLLST